MELEDGAFPYLGSVIYGSDPYQVFEGIDYAFFLGAKPRGPGMERKDLLHENGGIFVEQGKALRKSASKHVTSLVVGNPSNTNCLVLAHNAKDISFDQFHAMTRLDQNRAIYQLANQAGVDVSLVEPMIIWGNHSKTQVPDYQNAMINGLPVKQVIQDHDWLENVFIPLIQNRGAEVIQARGKSSAASAANAGLDAMKSIVGHDERKYFSSGVYSKNNAYGIDEDLFFSFPCKLDSNQKVCIDSAFNLDEKLLVRIKESEKELIEERDAVRHLLG
jgi:malate dehydrogenase